MSAAEQAPERPIVLLLGPQRSAISGVSTHLNQLFESSLGDHFRLRHFQIGSEGRQEGRLARLVRLLISPCRLAWSLLSERVHIVHLNTSLNRRAYLRDLVYMIVARLFGVRVLYQIHGGDLPQQFSGHSPLLSRLLRASLQLPEVIVVLARCELEAYRRFIPGGSIRLLPNGIDPAPYAELGRPPLRQASALQLLYLGRLSRDKGIFDALHGVRLARLQHAAVHLTIAGGGPDEAALRQAVRDLNLENDVTFVGPVFGDAKLQQLARAEVLILPSYSEGLPYALLECMAAGLPAITTPVGAIPDVVVDRRHGILVPAQDSPAIGRAIVQLANAPDLLAQMSADCRHRVATTYSIRGVVDGFAQLYAELTLPRRSDTARQL